MMCDPCFMDANPGELTSSRNSTGMKIQEILDNATKIKPRRQMFVQFSGGEAHDASALSIDAVRYARKVGYNSVQAATNRN